MSSCRTLRVFMYVLDSTCLPVGLCVSSCWTLRVCLLDSTCLPVRVELYVSSCTCWTLRVFLHVSDSTCLPACVGLYVSSCTCRTPRVFLYVLDSTCLPVRVGPITEKHGGSGGGWWATRGGLEVDLLPFLDFRER